MGSGHGPVETESGSLWLKPDGLDFKLTERGTVIFLLIVNLTGSRITLGIGL